MSGSKTIAVRFWPRVNKGPSCWIWVGIKDRCGYGVMGHGRKGGGNAQAHRVSWELVNGDIPHGMFVLHRCDNPPCVNPDHLFLGNAGDNRRDAMSKNRVPRGATHYAHKLTEADVCAILASKERGVDLAARFGVGATEISNIRKRRCWKYLTDEQTNTQPTEQT